MVHMPTVRNKKLYAVGNAIAAIGGLVMVIIAIFSLLSISLGIPVFYFGGVIPANLMDIARIVFGILIFAIYENSPWLRGQTKCWSLWSLALP